MKRNVESLEPSSILEQHYRLLFDFLARSLKSIFDIWVFWNFTPASIIYPLGLPQKHDYIFLPKKWIIR